MMGMMIRMMVVARRWIVKRELRCKCEEEDDDDAEDDVEGRV